MNKRSGAGPLTRRSIGRSGPEPLVSGGHPNRGSRFLVRAARRSLLALVGLMLIGPRLGSQETKPAKEPSAHELLELAVRAQGHDPRHVHPDHLALHVRMTLQFLTDRGDDVSLQVETKFLAGGKDRKKDRIWKRVSDGDTAPITAFDGTTPWTQRSSSDPVIDLRGPDYAVDRDRLKEDIQLTRTLARLFLLENLARELKELRRLEDQSEGETSAYVLEGKAVQKDEDEERPVVIRLWIEKGSHHLLGCRVQPLKGDEEPLDLCFWGWRKKDGRWVPKSIKLHRGNSKEPQQTIYPSTLIVGAPLEEKDFSPPR